MTLKMKCSGKYPPDLRHVDYRPCKTRAVVEVNGKPYCAKHIPVPQEPPTPAAPKGAPEAAKPAEAAAAPALILPANALRTMVREADDRRWQALDEIKSAMAQLERIAESLRRDGIGYALALNAMPFENLTRAAGNAWEMAGIARAMYPALGMSRTASTAEALDKHPAVLAARKAMGR